MKTIQYKVQSVNWGEGFKNASLIEYIEPTEENPRPHSGNHIRVKFDEGDAGYDGVVPGAILTVTITV